MCPKVAPLLLDARAAQHAVTGGPACVETLPSHVLYTPCSSAGAAGGRHAGEGAQ